MNSSILDPFRLDALFREYRLSGTSCRAKAGSIEKFSELFFQGAESSESFGLSLTQSNSIKRLSSSQGRGFLRTLYGIKSFFSAGNLPIIKQNARVLFSFLGDDYERFITYVKSNSTNRFLTLDETNQLLSAGNDYAELLFLSFKHAYMHLDHVTGIAAKTLYEQAQTLYMGAETRLRICQELSSLNPDACAEYADWISDECGDKIKAITIYSLHPDSNLCLWQIGNKIRQCYKDSNPLLTDRFVKKTASKVKKQLSAPLNQTCSDILSRSCFINNSPALRLAFSIFLYLINCPEPFSKAYTAISQMLSSGEVTVGDSVETEQLSVFYQEAAISAGELTPILNISNHLATIYANNTVMPIGYRVQPLSPLMMSTMKRYNSLAMDLGFRSCKFSKLKIDVCDCICNKTPLDHEHLYNYLLELETEDYAVPSGINRVFVTRSEYWSLRGDVSANPEEQYECFMKAIKIEEKEHYDHLPQLVHKLCTICLKNDIGDDYLLLTLLNRYASALCSDKRYAASTEDMLSKLDK